MAALHAGIRALDTPAAARRSVRPWALAALLSITASLLVFVHVRLYEYSFDDAYIHFRIANHLMRQGAPTFNANESVNASSAPAWTVLLAAEMGIMSLLGASVPFPAVVAVLNALITLAGAIVYTLLLMRVTASEPSLILYGIWFVTYIALVLCSSLGLMETPLALLVAGIAFSLILTGRPLGFTLVALAPFLRPELVIPLALAWLYLVFVRHIRYLVALAFTLAGLMPFVIYNLYYFGSLVPNTITAKARLYSLSGGAVFADIVCSVFSCKGWDLSIGRGVSFEVPWLVALLSVGGAATCTAWCYVKASGNPRGGSTADGRHGVGLVLLAWGVIVAGVYWAARAFVFPWYTPLFAVPLAFAVAHASRLCRPLRWRVALLSCAAPILASTWSFVPQVVTAAALDPTYYSGFGMGARVRKYIQLGQALERLYPTATILTAEIGGLGYGFRGHIADGAGLVSPSALRYHPLRIPEERSSGYVGAIPLAFAEETKPDIIVSYDIFITGFRGSETARHYIHIRCPVFRDDDLRRSAQNSLWGSRYLDVYVREGLMAGVRGGMGERPISCLEQ